MRVTATLLQATEVCRAPGVCTRAKHDVKMSIVAEAPLKVGFELPVLENGWWCTEPISQTVCLHFPQKAEETLATRDDIRNIAIIAHVDHGASNSQ
eukprot:29282-Eustigmatos_ZCMA.PRE.1